MDLKSRIQEDMKATMRAQDKKRLGVVRLILAAIKQVEVDERVAMDDQKILTILDKMVKQRRESLAQYEQASRNDLAEQETYEIKLIQEFLPQALTDAEVDQLIATAMKTADAKSMQDMGKVMAQLKPQIQGRADAAVVSSKVKQQLALLAG